MRQFSALIAALLLAVPAQAEETSMEDLLKQFEDLSDQAQTLLEGWVEEIGPKLDEVGPMLEDLAARLGDLSAYHPPEVLENGDILIRRKKPLPPTEPAPDAEAEPSEPGKVIDL